MEGGNLPPGNMMQGAPFGGLDLHGNSLQMHAPSSANQAFNHSQMPGDFSAPMNRVPESDHLSAVPFGEYGKADHHHHHHHHHNHHGKNSMSDDEEPSLPEDGVDSQSSKGKKGSPWQRMKWTDVMVKLLITAVSYTGEDPGHDYSCGGRRKFTMMQKKGKWKAISKVMGERGCYVSPQQCEDKFNDLNKRYKRLTDILGRGTSCKVVENPALLDCMDRLSDKMKEDVRKILSSKHLFYEEMCSYHNNNRLNLPEDPALQRSLQLALRSKDEHDPRRGANEDVDEDDQSADTDYEEENDEEHHALHGNMGGSCMQKRMRHAVDREDVGFGNCSSSQDFSRRSDPHGITVDINKVFPDGTNLAAYSAELEKQRLHIEAQMLELAMQRLKWERFSKKKDRELERMRLENEQMKIENNRLELELKHKELELEHKLKGNGNHA